MAPPDEQLPAPFGMSVAVEDMAAACRFYADLCPHDRISEGDFAGITYAGIMRGGETVVNIFQKGEGNPLADVIPTLKVGSVGAYVDRIRALGGAVVIPAAICPCTGAPFAVCTDPAGNQIMVKEPARGTRLPAEAQA